MSMTSKVNPTLRQQIINELTKFGPNTNQGILTFVPAATSLRMVQEATQKLTREGVIVKQGNRFAINLSANQATVAAAV